MHDIKSIRDSPAAFETAMRRRGGPFSADPIIHIDTNLRGRLTEREELLAHRNAVAHKIGQLRRTNEAVPPQLDQDAASIKERLAIIEADPNQNPDGLKQSLNRELEKLPNLPDPSVPPGNDESDNVIVYVRGKVRTFDFTPAEHFVIGPALGLDFETAQKVAGARFAYLRGPVARLARALGQFMLDIHTGEFGYQEVSPPLLVRDSALFGTGQLPKFADDQFRTDDGRALIPTAEVSLTNIVSGDILGDLATPLRFTALTPCFRKEAGAAGRDTRGLIRQHQFDKVELVSITRPEQSDAEHERMTACAETVLDRLELPFRRMLLCTGDMGFSARKTFDLEVWLPGQNAFREISSCSNCGDFQARRMNSRYRAEGEKATRFVHTLNGSALAVGRTLVAVIENYQQMDGRVVVPAALINYMGGVSMIEPL